MRMNLAVLDWVSLYCAVHRPPPLPLISTVLQNENVRRAVTSHRLYLNVQRPNHHSPSRVLVEKTFMFVQEIWETYIHTNQQSTLCVLASENA